MIKRGILLFIVLLSMGAVAGAGSSVQVMLRGKPLTLMGETLQVGKPLPDVSLPDASMTMTPLSSLKGKVTIISVVPSIDTKVCEKQTHLLSEKNGGLDATARLITISRDLPFAQKRFAEEARIHNVTFLSDYREAAFGHAAGLLIEQSRLLTRAIMVLDREGIVRYLEIVPDLGQLPEMMKAFEFARTL